MLILNLLAKFLTPHISILFGEAIIAGAGIISGSEIISGPGIISDPGIMSGPAPGLCPVTRSCLVPGSFSSLYILGLASMILPFEQSQFDLSLVSPILRLILEKFLLAGYDDLWGSFAYSCQYLVMITMVINKQTNRRNLNSLHKSMVRSEDCQDILRKNSLISFSQKIFAMTFDVMRF